MKVVVLCGGMGTRLREETEVRPKPMVEVGGRPILWHIMKIYSHHGFDDFVLCLGYKGSVIRRYFLDYYHENCDLTIDLSRPDGVQAHGPHPEHWKVTLAETGLETMTAQRIKRAARYLGQDDVFMLTYGDGVADVDLRALLAFHRSHGKLATVTAVHPSSRWGELVLDGDAAAEFREKPQLTEGFINGGFFVLDRRVLDYIDDDPTVPFERGPMQRLTADGQLMAFRHEGFWQAMDTLRDMTSLNELWASGRPPWKVWA
ncbi:MAG: glucose-1-phosphate cytidylyltransferase [Proteobacteria bacterium]|nr:glucose-1-phosphate cytidylyltransferase [Pseudomonadota bacterium]